MNPQDNTSSKAIVPQNPFIARLQSEVQHPFDIDRATRKLGIAPFLVNPYLASIVDLSFVGLDRGINLPVQISELPGGRSSLYYLQPGQKVVASIVATPSRLLFRYVTRESGHSMPAAGGDVYVEELRDLDGNVVGRAEGILHVLDASKGEGQIVFANEKPGWRWWLWSCFASGDYPVRTE